MSEFDPTKREHINFAPLERFRLDTAEAGSFVDLYLSVTRYLTDEFNIDDYYVDRMFQTDIDMLPTPEMFELDPDLAREKAWLILIKLALPLAENMIENDESFMQWTQNTVDMVIASVSPAHEVEDCMKKSHGSASHSCAASSECPLKITAYTLISEAARADMSGLDYHPDWVKQKRARTISKIEIAKDFGMIDAKVAGMTTQQYLGRSYLRSKNPGN